MGLFSRLKQAFSLPESETSQATSAASEAADSTASQAKGGASATSVDESSVSQSVDSASESPIASEAPVAATSTAPTSNVSNSLAAAADVESTGQPVESAAASVAPISATVSSEADATVAESTAPVVTESAGSDIAESEVVDADVSNSEVANSEVTDSEVADSEDADEPTEAERYDEGLKKSRKTFGDRINAFLANFRHVDEGFFDELEDTLIESDVGYETAMRISDELRDEVKLKNAKSKKEISSVIVEKLVDMYGEAGRGEDNSIHLAKSGPTVILFVGVNGAGKTTTIGKMANMYKQQGKKVLLAACDTFRAGAIQQLQVWGERDGVDVVAGPEKSDPASVCFDAVKKAKAEDYDILFVDTAGRLQNKINLMNELEKIKRVITREIPAAPQEVLLVLDATTGQNALNQAKLFKQSTAVTGIVLTKLDGTARGGIVLAIRNELHLAVKYVGLGEKVTDLRPFNANDFVYGLFKDVIAG